jgi:hypothetical protein
MDTVGHHSALFIEKTTGGYARIYWKFTISGKFHAPRARGVRVHMPRAKADRMSQLWKNHGIKNFYKIRSVGAQA